VYKVNFFLNRRIEFIRQLYRTASAPYVERMQKIEDGEEPFVQPYGENDEPAFLEEWMEADESLQVLAYSCVSLLAAALHLYLETWVMQSGVPIDESLKKSVFKKHGWFAGYINHFSQNFKIVFEEVPADLDLLEEVVLARNRIEHPHSIASNRTQYSEADFKKLRPPFFVNKEEAALLADADKDEKAWFIPITLYVTEEKILAALSEAERFAEWFEAEIESRVYVR